MTGDDRLIEDIVRSVLEQFENGGNTARTQASGGRKPPVAHNDSVPNNSVQINASVITGDLLKTQVNGSRGIILTPKAILTPSARDVIRNRGIEVTRCEADSSATSTTWKVFATCTTPALEQVLDDTMLGFADRELVDSDHEAATVAISAVCRAETDGALVFTHRPQQVACLANRNRRVRAAIAADATDIKRAVAEIGANLLCVDPRDQPWFGLRNLLRQLQTAGVPRVPQNWPE